MSIDFNSGLEVHGTFEQRIYKMVDGELTLVEEYCDPNLVVNLGKGKITRLLANDGVGNYVSSIAVGTSLTTPTVADTVITDSFIKSLTGYLFPSATSVRFEWTLELTEANGKAISEYGLITQDGTLFSRKTRGTINKESDVKIDGSWTITLV